MTLESFRGEVRALLAEPAVTDEVVRSRRLPDGQEPELLNVYRRLGERGWLAPNWPREYGGIGASTAHKAVVTEELIYHGVPDVVHGLSIDIVGLGVLQHGTADQKARLLPPLARGETTATVLFSEPGVGSDLSALTTRAEPDGDGWRLHGRKTYSMKTHVADFALCAARTSRAPVKYHGLTLFLAPLTNHGAVVRPLWNLCDDAFADVSLNGIRVTRDDVLGEVDAGWHTVNQLLGLERTGVDTAAKATRLCEALLRYAKKSGRLDEPGYAAPLLRLEAKVRAARLLAWRCVADLDAGTPDEVRSATAKWYATETFKELSGAALELTGLDGTLEAADPESYGDGVTAWAYREAPGLTLAAGTSEIMLYLIAGSGLGLLS